MFFAVKGTFCEAALPECPIRGWMGPLARGRATMLRSYYLYDTLYCDFFLMRWSSPRPENLEVVHFSSLFFERRLLFTAIRFLCQS